MSFIRKIDLQVDLIARIAKAKQTVDYLKINWETDTEVMNFGRLYGGNPVLNHRFLRMDKITVDPNTNKEDLFDRESRADTERMLNLIELMNSGANIIPPICMDTIVVKDGVKELKGSNTVIDGRLRMKVAAYLQLTEIPVVVFERVSSYLFTPGKWGFEIRKARNMNIGGWLYNGSYLEAVSASGEIVKMPGQNKPVTISEGNYDYIEFQMI